MTGLDTNVLVHYIMWDNAKQSLKATKLMEVLTVDGPGFVSLVSVVELGWVLSSSSADFADCLIERTAASAGCGRTMTFDVGAAKMSGTTLIQ